MKLLDYADLKERGIPYSPSQLYRRELAGTFPKSIKLSAVRKAWAENEINAWIKARIRERDGTAA